MSNLTNKNDPWRLLALLAVTLAPTGAALAGQFDIPAQDLAVALESFAKQADREVLFDRDQTLGKQSVRIRGDLAPADALKTLIGQSGLAIRQVNERTFVVGTAKGKESNPGTQTGSLSTQMRLASASAQDAGRTVESEAEESKGEEVVVTGSRVATNPSQMAANVIVLDAQALQATGESKLEDALRQLPQNMFGASAVGAGVTGNFNGGINVTGASSINLRGLGNESTLILVDGRRIGKSGVFGGVSDISGIPLRSVERVEIMLDGASSVYGSDAVGGVVNIITKKDYSGVEASYQYGVPEKGGFDEHVATVSGGMSWRGGRSWAMFEGYNHSALDAADRPEIIRSSLNSNPGTVGAQYVRYQGQIYRVRVLVTQLGSATYQQYLSNGTIQFVGGRLPADHAGSSLAISDLVFTPAYRYSSGSYAPTVESDNVGISLLPEQQRITVQTGFEQSLPLGGMTLSGNVYYSRRDTYAASGPFEISAGFPVADPRNQLGESTSIRWTIPDWADKHYSTDQDVMRWSMAVDGTLAGKFRWQLSGGQSRDDMSSFKFNEAVNGNYFNAATIAQYEAWGIVPDLRYTNAYNAGLNILAGDIVAANSPELLQMLRVPQSSMLALNRENTGEFRMDGALFRMPGGAAHMAVGMDWRQEMLRTASQHRASRTQSFQGAVVGAIESSSLPYGAYEEVSIGRTQHAMFAELLLPLIGQRNAMPLIRRLNLTGATRLDDYHGYDEASTWSAGLIWSPVSAVNVRANRSTSYVAPTFRDQLDVTTYYDSVFDQTPPMPGREVLVVDANGVPTGEVEYIGMTISGGNPDLKPENADITSAGLEFVPASLPGLSLRATWHHTEYQNRIGPSPQIEGFGYSPALGAEVILAGDYDTRYGAAFYRDTDGRLTWDFRSTNISRLEMAGIDYQARYDFSTSLGRFIVSANVAYTSQYDVVQQAGDTPVNQVGNVGFQTGTVIPEYRYGADAQWFHRGYSVSLGLSSASKTTSTGSDSYGEVIQRIAEYPVKMDLVLGFDVDQSGWQTVPGWARGLNVSLRIPRLLDETTKYSVMSLTRNERYAWAELNANVADPIGRVFYLNLAKRF